MCVPHFTPVTRVHKRGEREERVERDLSSIDASECASEASVHLQKVFRGTLLGMTGSERPSRSPNRASRVEQSAQTAGQNALFASEFAALPLCLFVRLHLCSHRVWQSYHKLSFKVNALNSILLFVVLPLYIYGNWYNSAIVIGVDYLLMLLVLFVSINGVRFGGKLCKELESSLLSKTLVPTIRGVVAYGCFSAWTVIVVGLGYNMGFRATGNKWIR